MHCSCLLLDYSGWFSLFLRMVLCRKYLNGLLFSRSENLILPFLSQISIHIFSNCPPISPQQNMLTQTQIPTAHFANLREPCAAFQDALGSDAFGHGPDCSVK